MIVAYIAVDWLRRRRFRIGLFVDGYSDRLAGSTSAIFALAVVHEDVSAADAMGKITVFLGACRNVLPQPFHVAAMLSHGTLTFGSGTFRSMSKKQQSLLFVNDTIFLRCFPIGLICGR